MFEIGELVGESYRVDGVCSKSGGMGEILFVTPTVIPAPFPLVLKYCRELDDELLRRFRREVRLMARFAGNTKIVQLWDHALEASPPYFVMKFYPDGDLSSLSEVLKDSFEQQELSFLKMIACIQELHSVNEYHRDIKPQNFLRDGENLVVSDLGLSTEVESVTGFTRSSIFWGTHGYMPPEFTQGGFKHADAAGDIYMLGKTFYVLLTGRDPAYLMKDGIPPPIFHIINRCCSLSKDARYSTLAELQQSLVSSYDVLLNRTGGVLQGLYLAIKDRLATVSQYDAGEVTRFIEHLAMTNSDEQSQIINELPPTFFSVISQEPLAGSLNTFLSIYGEHVDRQGYTWSYAETVAKEMYSIFQVNTVPPDLRALALDIAIRAAAYMNRFAAMDTCKAMVKGISDQTLALHVVPLIMRGDAHFFADLEPSACSNELVQNAVRGLRDLPQ